MTLRMTAKQLENSAKRHQKNSRKERLNVKRYMQQGDADLVQISAEAAIREDNLRVQCMRLASSIKGTVGKLQTQQHVMMTATAMGRVSYELERAASRMDLGKIAESMALFERQGEDLDVQQSFVESVLASTTSSVTPELQVSKLVQAVADEHHLEIGHSLSRLIVNEEPSPDRVDDDVRAATVTASDDTAIAVVVDDSSDPKQELEDRLRALKTFNKDA